MSKPIYFSCVMFSWHNWTKCYKFVSDILSMWNTAHLLQCEITSPKAPTWWVKILSELCIVQGFILCCGIHYIVQSVHKDTSYVLYHFMVMSYHILHVCHNTDITLCAVSLHIMILLYIKYTGCYTNYDTKYYEIEIT